MLVGLAFATGLAGNLTGRAGGWWVFALHGIAGLALGLFLVPKLRRVLPRLWPLARWHGREIIGVFSAALVLLTLTSGMWWIGGGVFAFGGFGLLNWHITLGFLLVALVSAHMLVRAKPLRMRDLTGRRQAVRWLLLTAGGAALWPVQQRVAASARRFTGSRPTGDYAGNAFPPTSWVADNPHPLAQNAAAMQIGGHVDRPFSLPHAALTANDYLDATLDCTGGFCTTHVWRGTRVGTLLDHAAVRPGARWVRFRSVTGYRWSLPLAEARDALLATQVDDEPLTHAHGAPARLVAPGHRGFAWVKWVVALEVLTAPDPAEAIAMHTSSFTAAGRGQSSVVSRQRSGDAGPAPDD